MEQKHEICVWYKDNKDKKVTQKDVIAHFSRKFKTVLKKSMISNTLAKAEEICKLATETSVKCRNRKAKHPELEECLYMWFREMRLFNGQLADDALIEKAKKYGEMLVQIQEHKELEKFRYSVGWLQKFKKRFEIIRKVLHGEAASVDMVYIERFLVPI
jgi:hypothetical protein